MNISYVPGIFEQPIVMKSLNCFSVTGSLKLNVYTSVLDDTGAQQDHIKYFIKNTKKDVRSAVRMILFI